MNLTAALADHCVLPLIVTYQTEGPRIDYACREARRLGLNPRIALSIRSDDPRVAELYDPELNFRLRKKAMTAGEIACYWGHREAWRLLLEDGADFALVLEDDFQVKDDELLQSAIRALPKMPAFDILLLRMHKPRGPVRRWSIEGVCVEERIFGATGATGYLITAQAARKLLARPRIFRPVDEDFIAPWELGLRVLNLNPEPIGETTALTSSLDEQRCTRATGRKRPLRSAWLKTRWQMLSLAHWLRQGVLRPGRPPAGRP